MRFMDDGWLLIFFFALTIGALALIGWAIYDNHQHKLFLEQHGCQIVFQSKTGRWIHTGKMGHPEVITLYECADVNRTEVN